MRTEEIEQRKERKEAKGAFDERIGFKVTLVGGVPEQHLDELPVDEAVIHGENMEAGLGGVDHRHGGTRRRDRPNHPRRKEPWLQGVPCGGAAVGVAWWLMRHLGGSGEEDIGGGDHHGTPHQSRRRRRSGSIAGSPPRKARSGERITRANLHSKSGA